MNIFKHTGLAALAVYVCTSVVSAREVASDTIGLVQWISDTGAMERRFDATPGQLYATGFQDSGSNVVAKLTIGTPDGVRVPVGDPYALRRRPVDSIDYPEFFIECGPDVKLVDAKTVRMFGGNGPETIPAHASSSSVPMVPDDGSNAVTYTRWIKVKPTNGRYLLYADAVKDEISSMGAGSLMNNNFGDVFVTPVNGEILIEASFTSRADSDIAVTKLDVNLKEVMAVSAWQNGEKLVDDLSDHRSDYYFTDTCGTTSLGRLRQWVQNTYDSHKADFWANYEACGNVRLNGNQLRFSSLQRIQRQSFEFEGDTQTWYAGGGMEVALRVKSGDASVGDGSFRIIGFETGAPGLHEGVDYIYTTDNVASPPVVKTCDDLITQDWVRAPSQTTVAGTYKGQSCYVIQVRNDDGVPKRFYRAVADTGEDSGAYLYTELPLYAGGGVCLQSPNGSWWKLQVSDSGVVTATNVCTAADAPPGVGDF